MVEIERLRDSPNPGRGHVGLEVQPLSRPLASATGSTGGVVVTWVDPLGPAASALVVSDVMEEADGTRLTPQNWAVRAARVVPGEMLTIRVRRRGEVHEAVLMAAAAPPPSDVASLGALMRAVPGVGSEVLRVVPSGAAQRSGVEAGDVITLAGEITAPTPGQVRAAFDDGREGRGVLLAFTRGASHRVVVLGR